MQDVWLHNEDAPMSHHQSPVHMEPHGVNGSEPRWVRLLEATSHDDAAGNEVAPPNGRQPGVRLHHTTVP